MVTRQTVTVPAFGVAGRHAAARTALGIADYGSQRAAKIAKVTKIAKGDLGFRPARHLRRETDRFQPQTLRTFDANCRATTRACGAHD